MTAIKYFLPVLLFLISALALVASIDTGFPKTLIGVSMGCLSLGTSGVGVWLLSTLNKRSGEIPKIDLDKDQLDDEFKRLEIERQSDKN
ncbi:MAG: hypothetical protein K2Y39_13800 [Candidatus Obscuribacterales bacterium]|nr:hypothetical protein [Candidatus Obscuribacterales bacterium]